MGGGPDVLEVPPTNQGQRFQSGRGWGIASREKLHAQRSWGRMVPGVLKEL